MNTDYELIDQKIEGLKDEMLELLSDWIKIPSVLDEAEPEYPYGKKAFDALDFILKKGREMGFKAKNVDNQAGHLEYGNGDGELYAVLGHVDVVPAGTGWTHGPFEGEISEGFVWGRGTSDDKGPTLAALYALKVIKELDLPPKNRLRIIMGTNEENGSKGIKHYMTKEEKPVEAVTPDAEFPVIFAEKGIINYQFNKTFSTQNGEAICTSLTGGFASNMVPSHAAIAIKTENQEAVRSIFHRFNPKNNAVLSLKTEDETVVIEAEGSSAHGSTPEKGINAISALIDLGSQMPFDPVFKAALIKLNEKIGYETNGKSLGVAGRDETSGPLTLNLGMIDFDGQNLQTTINIRYPIFYSDEMLTNQITQAMAPVLKTQNTPPTKPLFVSPDSDFIQTLSSIYEDVTGEPGTPFSIGGGTYARKVPLGVAYGAVFPGEPSVAHQPDERVAIESLVKTMKIYARLYYHWLFQ